MKKVLFAFALLAVSATAAAAQVPDLNSLIPQGSGSAAGRIIQLVALLTVLSVAPGLLVMVTSFTRFVVALSFLRSGLGLQNTPANLILISLSLFMTFYVMAPTFDKAWQDGVKPLMDNTMSEQEAFPKIAEPFRQFMLRQVRDKDLRLFEDLAPKANPRYTIGKFSTVWQRGQDGVWRVAFDGGDEGKPASDAEAAAFHAGLQLQCPAGTGRG